MRKLTNDELDRINPDEYKKAKKVPVVIVLDNVRSMNNIGSVFRTSDAFRVERIFLCGITAVPPNKEIHKTALGATESVEWKYYEQTADAIEKLKEEGYIICSIEQAEESVLLPKFNAKPGARYALVFGHEIRGVDQEILNRSDFCIEIPQYGTKHSLNISVSVGIVIWEIFRQTGHAIAGDSLG